MNEELREQLARLAELNDEELAELEASLVAAAEELAEDDSDDAIQALTEIAEATASVRTELADRETARAERAAERERLLSEINPTAETDGDDSDDESDDDSSDDESDAESTDSTDDADASAETEEQPAAVAASTTPPRAPMPRTRASRRNRPTQDTGPSVRMSLQASGDLPGFSAGQEIPSMERLAEAAANKMRSAVGTDGKYNIASLVAEYPEERTFTGDAWDNMRKVQAIRASAMESLTAALPESGLCAPLPVRYDLLVVAGAQRPVRDALPDFNADRGGVRTPFLPRMSQVSAGVSTGDIADYVAEEDPTTKPCVTVPCDTWDDAIVYPVIGCLEIDNFNYRFFREGFNAYWELVQAVHARIGEQKLLTALETNSDLVTYAPVLGTARDFFTAIDQLVGAIHPRERTSEDNIRVRMISPTFLRRMIRADFTRQQPGDDKVNISDAEIDAELAKIGITNPVWSPDYQLGTYAGTQAANAAINSYPTQVDVLVYIEGSHLFLNGGRLDFGTEIRDSALNEQNKVRAMFETFEGLHTPAGLQAFRVRLTTTCPNGKTSAPDDIDCPIS